MDVKAHELFNIGDIVLKGIRFNDQHQIINRKDGNDTNNRRLNESIWPDTKKTEYEGGHEDNRSGAVRT